MAEDKELKESLKKLVKETVGEIVAKLVKASAKKTVAELRKKLKDEAIRRLEAKLKETAEEQLEKQLVKSGRGLQRAITQDKADYPDYVSKLKQGFEQDFDKFLSSFRGLSALATTLIISLCVLVVAIVGVVFCCFAKPCPTQPEPQPDLVITGITFQMETIYYEEPTTETEFPSELYPAFDGCSPGYQLVIHYTIANQGDKEAGPSTSCLYICGEVVAEDTVGPLAAGESAEGTFDYYPFLREAFYYYLCYAGDSIDIKVCADCGQSVAESHEENDCLTLKFNQPY
jgi:hypothetical protein